MKVCGSTVKLQLKLAVLSTVEVGGIRNRWSLEANIGAGYVRLHYDKFRCKTCGEKVGTENRNYFGPTKAAISLIFLIK